MSCPGTRRKYDFVSFGKSSSVTPVVPLNIKTLSTPSLFNTKLLCVVTINCLPSHFADKWASSLFKFGCDKWFSGSSMRKRSHSSSASMASLIFIAFCSPFPTSVSGISSRCGRTPVSQLALVVVSIEIERDLSETTPFCSARSSLIALIRSSARKASFIWR